MNKQKPLQIAVDAREMVLHKAGKARYTTEIIRYLARLDTTNTYYLYMHEPFPESLPPNFETVLLKRFLGLKQLWLALDARRRGCDVLFAPTAYLPVVFSLIPSVVTVHDLAPFVSPQARPALRTLLAERFLLHWAVRKARAVISVSQSTRHDLIQLFRIPANKITVTVLGYDAAQFVPPSSANKAADQAVLKKYNLSPNYLFFIGTLEPRKNIIGLIEGYSRLSPALQDQYPLVIGGGKGWFYEAIFARVNELKLESKITFLGRVPDEDLPTLYRQAKLFVFPSFYEGFGLPPLEALACATPVITSKTSSLPEVVGSAGRLVDPLDPTTITEAITELVQDEAIYRDVKRQAPDQAKQFDWQRTAKQTQAILAGD